MARKKISEWKAKTLVYKDLENPYAGLQVSSSNASSVLESLDSSKKYVVKIDQGVKKRFKTGLAFVDKTVEEVKKHSEELKEKGYEQFIVEEFVPHNESEESYLSIERVREGKKVLFSSKGGVDIENEVESVETFIVSSDTDTKEIAKKLQMPHELFSKLFQAFDTYYFSFMEINPLVIIKEDVYFLDMAVEVDSTAEFFVKGAWSEKDFVESIRQDFQEVESVKQLAAKSTAAFSLTVLNPNGSMGMLLSSGGASIALADEVGSQGFGKELLNYGEYSGGPNIEETYIYAKNILSLLLKSTAKKKVLVIAGGVANFTDIRVTFRGIIKALDEVKTEVQSQKIKVYVRRGGPNQEEGLKMMKEFLEKEQLFGVVSGPDLVLTGVVSYATAYLKND